jgi:hypothetical protein
LRVKLATNTKPAKQKPARRIYDLMMNLFDEGRRIGLPLRDETGFEIVLTICFTPAPQSILSVLWQNLSARV